MSSLVPLVFLISLLLAGAGASAAVVVVRQHSPLPRKAARDLNIMFKDEMTKAGLEE